MKDNVLEIIKSRLENESEMAFASFEEYAELYGYNETEDYFSFGVKRAIEIINAYIRLEKDEKNEENKIINDANNDVLAVAIHSIEQLQEIEAIVCDCLSPCAITPIDGIIAIRDLLKKENNENFKKKENVKDQEQKMYKDIKDVIKELENLKGFCYKLLGDNPDKSILLNDICALNVAIRIISDNHNNHIIEEARKKLEEK